MSKKTLLAGTSPFAHLMPSFMVRSPRAEDENPDEEARKARRAEEDARRAEEDERRKEEDAKRADEDGTDGDDESDEDEDEENEKEKARKARKAENDDDSDAEDGDDDGGHKDEKEAAAYRKGLSAGRSRENARCAAIFAHPKAAANPAFAATLAFVTRNSSAEAASLMAVSGAAPKRGRSLDDRMAGRRDPKPGADGGRGTGTGTMAEQMISVGQKLGQVAKS